MRLLSGIWNSRFEEGLYLFKSLDLGKRAERI
jgi:hypothetical protein